MTERRMARRYDLSLPVTGCLPTNQDSGPFSGHTRDISTRGMYFITQTDFALGAEADFTVAMPADITPSTEVFVRVHGHVVRIDKRRDDKRENIGIAAVIERQDIMPRKRTLI